jgi:TolB-like protein/DNA-binding winged helix-turn-helix (wHTH) protein/Flp pilus assembly protein TadD
VENGIRIGGSYYVEPSLNSITGPAGPTRLEPKIMQVLVCLAAHAGHVVSKEHLMRTVWADTFVGDDVLTRAISELRRTFGDDVKEPRFIQTIPKGGYRLIASVSPTAAELAGPAHDSHDAAVRRRWAWSAWVTVLAAVATVACVVWYWKGVGTQRPRVTIAVLPFEHLGGDPERRYVTEGLTEETTAMLGQIDPEHVSVIGRTSTRLYKATNKSVVEIGRELGVEYLVEGSVRTEQGRLRVTSKLIRVRDQVQVWADSYDSESDSLLDVQQDLSTAIARQIHLRVSPARLSVLSRRHSRNAEAYDLYLRGRHLWHQFTAQTNRRAVEFYVRATQLDPEYALAWSGLADAYTASPINADAASLEIAPRARDAAARAVQYGPNLAETQTSLGLVRFWLDWNWPAAEAALRNAISLDSSYSEAPRVLGIVLAYLGRHDEAGAAMRRARELEPLFPMEHALSAHVAFAARDYTSGLQFARHASVLGPQFWIGQLQLAQLYEQVGDDYSARQALRITEQFSDANTKMLSLRGYLLSKLGRTSEAREVLSTLETVARERYVPPYSMALVRAGLGDRDAALQWLERAFQVRDVHLVFLVVDPKWDPYRADPRFEALLARCGFPRAERARPRAQ